MLVYIQLACDSPATHTSDCSQVDMSFETIFASHVGSSIYFIRSLGCLASVVHLKGLMKPADAPNMIATLVSMMFTPRLSPAIEAIGYLQIKVPNITVTALAKGDLRYLHVKKCSRKSMR